MLNATLLALSDPTRRAILTRLAEGEATVNDLAAPFAISQPAISQHIKVLEHAGLILRRVDGTRRPCRLNPAAFEEIDAYLTFLRTRLSFNYDRLDQLLSQTPQPKE
jgi:DNA-binding transcriptional ArsR family regulator